MFTTTDKALLDRAARYLANEAKKLQQTYGQQSWGADKKCKAAKLEFDRLERDARDLRMLAHRLTKFAKGYNTPNQILPIQPALGAGGQEVCQTVILQN